MRYDQKIPADWQCEYIGSLLSDIGAGTSVNGYDYPATDGERGVLKLGAVAVGGGFKPSENKEIKPEELVDKLLFDEVFEVLDEVDRQAHKVLGQFSAL